jgi:hypothetical protein
MTGAEAIAQIQQGLGWRSDKAVEILAALNFAQDEREQPGKTLPWYLLSEDQPLAVSSGVQAVSLPTGFIKEVEERDGNLRYQPNATSRTLFLTKTSYENAEKFFFGDWRVEDLSATASVATVVIGAPRAYVLRSNTIRVYPKPDADYTLTWSYWSHDTDITSGSSTNQWLTYNPWVIVGEAGLKMAADLQNQAATQKFATILQRAEMNLMASVVERELSGRRLAMGSRL